MKKAIANWTNYKLCAIENTMSLMVELNCIKVGDV